MFNFKPATRGHWAFENVNLLADDVKVTGIYADGATTAVMSDGTPADTTLIHELETEFNNFKLTSPVYALDSDYLRFKNGDDAKIMYLELLKGCIYARESFEGGTERAQHEYDRVAQWLGNTDFFVAPASTRFHDACAAGLVEHSLKVAYHMRELINGVPSFSSIKLESGVLASLAHDWAKIGIYELYNRNVKNETTGVWEPTPSYRHKASPIPLPHGMASLWVAQRLIRLNLDEGLAIVHHMGKWHTPDCEDNQLQQANEDYPLVHALQFADQLSITNYAR